MIKKTLYSFNWGCGSSSYRISMKTKELLFFCLFVWLFPLSILVVYEIFLSIFFFVCNNFKFFFYLDTNSIKTKKNERNATKCVDRLSMTWTSFSFVWMKTKIFTTLYREFASIFIDIVCFPSSFLIIFTTLPHSISTAEWIFELCIFTNSMNSLFFL